MRRLVGAALGAGLVGCVAPSSVEVPLTCDPRTLEPGETRALEVRCTDVLVSGGEGRVGDWLIENAVARFVVRGAYADLYTLDRDGGTLIDAARVDGLDLLAELAPEGDRSVVTAVEGDGWAELRLPGFTWHLDADRAALELRAPAASDDGASDADSPADPLETGLTTRLWALPGVRRTYATLIGGDSWFGLDGQAVSGDGPIVVENTRLVAVDTAERWPDGELREGWSESNRMRVEVDGALITRLPVVDERWSGTLPVGAEVRAERYGCWYYDGHELGCGEYTVRVRDDTGARIPAILAYDGVQLVVPAGGEVMRVPMGSRAMEVYAGPAYSIAPVQYDGPRDDVTVQLTREMDLTGVALARLDLRAWPDGSLLTWDALHLAEAEGARLGIAVADDEVPPSGRYTHDTIQYAIGSRGGGLVWSWPWSQNSRKAGHGALDATGLGALDLLTAMEGAAASNRLTVVVPAWVEQARAEAPPWDWRERPDALWLDSLDDLDAYLGLLDDRVDVAPVGPYTWIEVVDDNLTGLERGIVDGRTTAGNGPRLALRPIRDPLGAGEGVEVHVEGSRWMGPLDVTVYTSGGGRTVALDDDGTGRVWFARLPDWAVATASGHVTRDPWLTTPAWAVSGPVWLTQPGDTPDTPR